MDIEHYVVVSFFLSFLEEFRSGKKIFVPIWNIENGFFFLQVQRIGFRNFLIQV